MTRKAFTSTLYATAALLGLASFAAAQGSVISDNVIRIGVLNDRSGVYADLAGEGSVVAARMAAEEFGNKIFGEPIEVIGADHQNKPDIGSAIARRWFDVEKVDAVADISSSATGFAVVGLADERNRIVLNASGSPDFTGKACTSTSFQWVYNSYTNGYGLASALTKDGLDSWFLLTVDYAFGHAFAADIRNAVEANGGKVVGEIRHPLNTSDFSSFLLQAQASGAKVIALANAGADMANSLKQAVEFGITQGQVVAAPSAFITDIDAIGLESSSGLQFVTAFYWDRNDEARNWAKKFSEKHGAMPTMTQAGVYSAVKHYLKAIEAAGTDEAEAVAEHMRKLPVEDAFASGSVRGDGQFVHDMYLAQVKRPSDSEGRWDYYNIISTIPGDEAFRALAESECPRVNE